MTISVFTRSLMVLGMVLPALVVSMSSTSASAQTSTQLPRLVSLPGSAAPEIVGARRLGAFTPTRNISVTVTLRLRNRLELSQLLHDMYTVNSPSYHHFLTVAQFAQRFAPTSQARLAVAQWLQGQGLRITGTSKNGVSIRAAGMVSSVEHAFNTSMFTYRIRNHSFFANNGDIRIPGSLSPEVLTVSGLSSQPQQHSALRIQRLKSLAVRGNTPSSIGGIYNLKSLTSSGINGSGVTVATATFGDYSTNDVAAFDSQFSLPTANMTRINVDGGASLGAQNGQDESELDIELVHGTAPGSKLLVYEAPNSNTSDQSFIDLYTRIISDNRASIVTTSWGASESQYPPADLTAIDQLFQEGAAQGQAFFAASGDSGAYDNTGGDSTSATDLAVDFPAADPWVTAVGGTSLTSSGPTYVGEVAWSDPTNSHGPAGSGGGLSSVFARPSYQVGPGVNNQYSNGRRQVPDVAANANPATGYAIYTVDSNGNPGWGTVGGTSAASPVWASFGAVVSQAIGRHVGFLNPALYQLGQKASTFSVAPFHDVTQGTNLYYFATVGWDYATGWGSFDATAFVTDLKTLVASTPGTLATATAVHPAVTIQSIVLLHTVKGKLTTTSALKLGEQGTIEVLYKTRNAGALKIGGSAALLQNGHSLKTLSLKTTTYAGMPALTAKVSVTSKKRLGTVQVHVTVKLGSIAAVLTRGFKVGLR